MDGGAEPLVCVAAGPGPVPRPVPGPPRRDHAVARRLAGRHGRSAAGMRTALPAAGPAGGRRRVLPAGRAPPAARRVREGRGGVPPGQPVGTRAAARPGAARLAQGQVDAAAAAIRRAVDEAQDRATRSRLLPALVEIMLAAGDVPAARAAADELSEIAADLDAPLPARHVRPRHGRRPARRGRRPRRPRALRRAWAAWHELEAPYEAARARVLIGSACRALGDDDSAEMELDAARRCSSSWAPRPTSPGWRSSPGQRLPGRRPG